MKCKRGDIWLVCFDPTRGSTRPALIIQNDVGNRHSNTTIIAAITSSVSEYPQNVILDPTKENGLSKKSCVKLSQILTVDQIRLIKPLGKVSHEDISNIDRAIQLSLGTL